MPDCLICIESFNKAVRRPVSCPYCNVAICRACTKECLLLSFDPKCQIPECGKPWSEDFLLDVMPRVWMYGEYRKHREKYCLDQERARLPETQENAKQFKDALHAYDVTKEQINKLKETMYATSEGQRYKEHSAYLLSRRKALVDFCKIHKLSWYYDPPIELETTPRKIMDEKKCLQKAVKDAGAGMESYLTTFRVATRDYQLQIRKLESNDHYRNIILVQSFGKLPLNFNQNGRPVSEAPKQNWTFTMKCPVTICEGFVSLNWSCGLCSVKVCKDCREAKPSEEEHMCDPVKRESVTALVKEAKPCPKCASQISKIDGCDQMWCTQCHTAFSWRSGMIEDHVHNPHYYEWMRRNGQTIPRAGLAPPVIGECLTPRQTLRQAELYLAAKPDMFAWIQPISHILNHSMHIGTYGNRNEVTMENEKRILRVKRLVTLIDDKKWGVALELLNMQKRRAVDSQDILQMFIQAASDILRHAMLDTTDPKDCARQMRELATYTNDQIIKHNSKYKHTMEAIYIP